MQEILEILSHRGRKDLVQLLQGSRYEIDESSTYGSYLFSTLSTVEIYAPLHAHDKLVALSDEDKQTILDAFLTLYPPKANSIEVVGVEFYMDSHKLPPKEAKPNRVTGVTRRDIYDAMAVAGIYWSGRLTEPDFLGRIFDLQNMPSSDRRYQHASDDIWQHRVANDDWEDDWVLHDKRFNLLKGSDEVFLRFLCEALHPVVRDDPEEVERLRQVFNEHLRHDGYELFEQRRISGRPVFAARRALPADGGVLEPIRERFTHADTAYVVGQIERMQRAVEDDPGLAIGTAKELVETCCKTILRERGAEVRGNPNLPQLVRQTARELALTPEDIPDSAKAAETIRRLLSNLATITQASAELRNQYGTGHGKDARTKGLQPRHARLAVGAASTLSLFLVETHEARPTHSRDTVGQ